MIYKYKPYSVSKIELFQSCPKKFGFTYIEKLKVDDSFFHLEKGSLGHSLIEHALKRKTKEFQKPIFKELVDQKYLQELKNCIGFLKSPFFLPYLQDIMVYKQYIEQRFSILEDGTVSLNKEYDPLFKGFIDLFQYDEFNAQIIDGKTGGKSKENLIRFPKSSFQLDVYAYVVSKIFNPQNIIGKYVFVEFEYEQVINNFNPRETGREIIGNIETIEKETEFKRNETTLCDWCKFRGYCLK